MKKFLFHLIIFLHFTHLPIEGQSISGKIDTLVQTYYENGVFNGAVLVAKKGEILYKKAFGYADREWGIPNTPDTKFRIASVSKPFTALLVLQLAEQGKINLNGKITDYFPDYKGRLGDSITIHQLLTHTSGIITSLEPDKEAVEERLYHSLRDMIRFTEAADLYFIPGKGFRYSNHGYYILAYIVEQVTGKRFEDVLTGKIFEPANMHNTSQAGHLRIEAKLAKGYEYKLLSGYENASQFDDSYTVGAGGLISTVEDLYRFDRALYSDNLISDDYKSMIFKPESKGNYGYGWFITKRKVGPGNDTIIIADHSGSINGFGSYIARVMSDSSFVIVLKNQRTDTYIDPAFAPDIGKQIISILYGESIELPKISIARHIACLIGQQGVDSAIAEYYRVKKGSASKYSMSESELNRLGIELLFRYKMTDEALRIFALNIEQFPKSYNVYDSYAYALMQKGDYNNSIASYKNGLMALRKYPSENDTIAARKDSEQALIYIKEMEEKLKNQHK